MPDTTTTTLTHITASEAIADVIQDYLADAVVAAPHGLYKDIAGEGLTASFPKWVSDVASFEEPAEGADLTPVALETTEASGITVGQQGLARKFTRRAGKATKLSMEELSNFAVGDGARVAALALDDDFVAVFPSFSESVGTSGSPNDMTVMAAALGQLGQNGANIPGAKVYVLHAQQNTDLLADYASSDASALADFYRPGGDQGGNSGSFMGIPVKFTGQCDTANLGVDVVGGLFSDGADPMNKEHAAVGVAVSELPKPYFETHAVSGSVTVSVIADWAAGMIENGRGVAITTAAPA